MIYTNLKNKMYLYIMEQLIDLIGEDCMDIIFYYKKEFERIEYNHKQIETCIYEEFDRDAFEDFFNNKFMNTDVEILEKRYYLDNFTVNDFKNYCNDEIFFMKTSFKFKIKSNDDFVSDYFQIKLQNIKQNYLQKLKIKYIYKASEFNLCIYLGDFTEDQLEQLYTCISIDFY